MTHQRFVLTLGFALLLTALQLTDLGAWAEEPPVLTTLETTWLQQTHDADSSETRLSRLEEALLGEARPNVPTSQRLEALQQLFVRYQTNSPSGSGASPLVEQPPVLESTTAMAPVSPPLIGALEQVILNRRFDDQADGDRLNRLEWKTFLTTFSSQPFNERIDRLVRRYPQAIEVARSVANFQQSQGQSGPAYTPPQVRPVTRP